VRARAVAVGIHALRAGLDDLLAEAMARADLIVAALAQHLDADLKTTNLKHFPMFPKLRAPY
jgi:predicted nucleic acid-binding protein